MGYFSKAKAAISKAVETAKAVVRSVKSAGKVAAAHAVEVAKDLSREAKSVALKATKVAHVRAEKYLDEVEDASSGAISSESKAAQSASLDAIEALLKSNVSRIGQTLSRNVADVTSYISAVQSDPSILIPASVRTIEKQALADAKALASYMSAYGEALKIKDDKLRDVKIEEYAHVLQVVPDAKENKEGEDEEVPQGSQA